MADPLALMEKRPEHLMLVQVHTLWLWSCTKHMPIDSHRMFLLHCSLVSLHIYVCIPFAETTCCNSGLLALASSQMLRLCNARTIVVIWFRTIVVPCAVSNSLHHNCGCMFYGHVIFFSQSSAHCKSTHAMQLLFLQ